MKARIAGIIGGALVGFLIGAGTGIVGGVFGGVAGVSIFTVVGAAWGLAPGLTLPTQFAAGGPGDKARPARFPNKPRYSSDGFHHNQRTADDDRGRN